MIPKFHQPSFVLRRYSAPDRVVTIELQQRLPAVVWLAALAWYLAAPSEVAAVCLFGLTGLLLGAWLWARTLALGVFAERRLHFAAVQVGDTLEEHLTLHNTTVLPVLWAEFVDRSDLPGYTVSSVRATDPGSVVRWRASALCTRRGLFSLGPWQMLLGDPFGLFLVRQIYTDRQELLVYPPLAPLPPQLLPHNSLIGDHRRLRQPVRADTLSATTTRHHAPGDPLHHIHWPTSARRDALYTKIFEPEATSTIWLVPDLDPAVHLGSGPDSSEETMVLLLASLADQLLRRRLSVGLLAQADTVHVLRPLPDRDQLWRMMRVLGPLRATSPYALAPALARLAVTLSARDRIAVVTPSLDATWPRSLGNLAQRGGLEAILLDPASFGGDRQAQPVLHALADQGVTAHIVRRGDLRPSPGAYGELRRWDFKTLATGRVIARQTPRPHSAGMEAGRA